MPIRIPDKKLQEELRPGTTVYTEKQEGPDVIRRESYTSDGQRLDEFLKKQAEQQRKLQEQKERAPYNALKQKLDNFRIAWMRPGTMGNGIVSLNETFSEFVKSFQNADKQIRDELTERELKSLFNIIKNYKDEFENILTIFEKLETHVEHYEHEKRQS
jgi:hypothetical protein